MNLGRFRAEREASWIELDGLVRAARGRPERLGPRRLLRLGALYRGAVADLALARRRFPGDPLTGRLEDLVGRARFLVYDARPREGSLREFVVRGYWRRLCERPVPLLVAAVLLLAPAALAAAWALADPAAAAGLVPEQFQEVTEQADRGTDLGFTRAEEAAFSSTVLTNNILVTFQAFALGLAAGIGTAVVLVTNGLTLGTIAGLLVGAGEADFFIALVAAHGVLELSCIVVAGAAGLRLGWALVDPGRRRRRDALVREGRRSVEIVLGTAPWLVLAGIVEGFVSRGGLGVVPVSVVGLTLGVVFWGLVAWRGRADRGELVHPPRSGPAYPPPSGPAYPPRSGPAYPPRSTAKATGASTRSAETASAARVAAS